LYVACVCFEGADEVGLVSPVLDSTGVGADVGSLPLLSKGSSWLAYCLRIVSLTLISALEEVVSAPWLKVERFKFRGEEERSERAVLSKGDGSD
jgi:hypothetical protein